MLPVTYKEKVELRELIKKGIYHAFSVLNQLYCKNCEIMKK